MTDLETRLRDTSEKFRRVLRDFKDSGGTRDDALWILTGMREEVGLVGLREAQGTRT